MSLIPNYIIVTTNFLLCRRMNIFLIAFIIILMVYAAVSVVLHWDFYRDPSNSRGSNWYIGFEQPQLNVSCLGLAKANRVRGSHCVDCRGLGTD